VPPHARDFSVKDRVIIVTGAGQGIGRELSRQFAAAGASVVIADINRANADRVRQEIEASGGKAAAVAADIGDKASVEAMSEAVVAQLGRIDVLINNAAIFATLQKKPFWEIPVDEWERVMRVNVTGVFLSVCAVLPVMRQQKWGRIINVSSDSVPKGVPNYLHYVSSKAAIIGMTNAMARELGPHGITVNCIRPGGVATEVDRVVNPTIERRIAQLSEQCIPRGIVFRSRRTCNVSFNARLRFHNRPDHRLRRRYDAQQLDRGHCNFGKTRAKIRHRRRNAAEGYCSAIRLRSRLPLQHWRLRVTKHYPAGCTAANPATTSH
jgi:NAD(P)-dependent dehydrogenase (short-subunit alcohol dehydrogenase family)